jgi:hypothetical protein
MGSRYADSDTSPRGSPHRDESSLATSPYQNQLMVVPPTIESRRAIHGYPPEA